MHLPIILASAVLHNFSLLLSSSWTSPLTPLCSPFCTSFVVLLEPALYVHFLHFLLYSPGVVGKRAKLSDMTSNLVILVFRAASFSHSIDQHLVVVICSRHGKDCFNFCYFIPACKLILYLYTIC